MDWHKIQAVNIFDEHLCQCPVSLWVAGQKDGVFLRGLLLQLKHWWKEQLHFSYNKTISILFKYFLRTLLSLKRSYRLSQTPVLQLASFCFLGLGRRGRVQELFAVVLLGSPCLESHPSSSGHRWRYSLPIGGKLQDQPQFTQFQDSLRHFGPKQRPSQRNLPTLISSFRELPSFRKGFTISSVTGKFLGSSALLIVGLIPLRNWYPKRSSSFQCSATSSDTIGTTIIVLLVFKASILMLCHLVSQRERPASLWRKLLDCCLAILGHPSSFITIIQESVHCIHHAKPTICPVTWKLDSRTLKL